MSFGHQASQKLQEWWILPWAFSVRAILRRKDWSCFEVCRIHEEARKIPNKTTKSKGCETRWERERDGNYGYYYNANILLWRFKMAHGTLGMLDAIVTFQDGAVLEPTDNLFSRFLVLGTCAGYPRTHRVTSDSIRKRLLRRRNKKKITRWIEDINSIFSWWKTIFYSLAGLLLKILFSLLEKIKFISSCRRVMFLSILYISLLF